MPAEGMWSFCFLTVKTWGGSCLSGKWLVTSNQNIDTF